MADQNELPSIVTFSEDVATQKAPDPLPAQSYPAEIVNAVIKLSKSGNRYVEVQVKVDPSAYPADFVDGNPDGTSLFYRRVTVEDTPASRYRLGQFTMKCGLPKIGRELNVTDWMGRPVRVDVKHERGQDGLLYAVADSLTSINV